MQITRKARLLSVSILFVYLVIVLWSTILNRHTGFHLAQTQLFWSYKLWFSGDWEYGFEILGNIVMFIPFGFLLSILTNKRLSILIVFPAAFIISLIIETSQLVLMRGLFEWDDVFNNVIGAIIGWFLFFIVFKLLAYKSEKYIISVLFFAFIFICFGFFLFGRKEKDETEDDSCKYYCFQIDRSEMENGNITLYGFDFVYRKALENIQIVLKSQKNGELIALDTKYGLPRPEVNDYFLCEYDYTNIGFVASGSVNESEEYEVLVKFPWSVPIPTNVYVTDDRVHFVKDEELIEPDGLEELMADSTLLIYRPDYHCWIYQKKGYLYWIVDQDFIFEEDGSTYIQYQLWTTQYDNLPSRRTDNGWNWDNIGGYFESYELEGDYGSYRIMRRKLPSSYSITSIVTGYYVDEKWIWKQYFRPVYHLS